MEKGYYEDSQPVELLPGVDDPSTGYTGDYQHDFSEAVRIAM